MFTVTVVDETTAGTTGEAWHLGIFEETLTLRELIRRRVFQDLNGFVVLVDDRQVEDLDATLALSMHTQVTFLKLVPQVGG